MSEQTMFARGYVAGRMDALPKNDEMMPCYEKWQKSTSFADSIAGLRALEAFASDRSMIQLAASFRTIRVDKHPACPHCDSILSWPSNDPGAEIAYCFSCKREWSLTAINTAVPA